MQADSGEFTLAGGGARGSRGTPRARPERLRFTEIRGPRRGFASRPPARILRGLRRAPREPRDPRAPPPAPVDSSVSLPPERSFSKPWPDRTADRVTDGLAERSHPGPGRPSLRGAGHSAGG